MSEHIVPIEPELFEQLFKGHLVCYNKLQPTDYRIYHIDRIILTLGENEHQWELVSLKRGTLPNHISYIRCFIIPIQQDDYRAEQIVYLIRNDQLTTSTTIQQHVASTTPMNHIVHQRWDVEPDEQFHVELSPDHTEFIKLIQRVYRSNQNDVTVAGLLLHTKL